MEFLQPLGALGFLAVAAILALYFLRRRYTDAYVSSTLLWEKALEEASAAHPFQRLRRSLIMILQLLAAALLALSLTRPALEGKTAGETVLIFDCSASMQASENGVSRMDWAVQEAKKRVDALAADAPLTILAVGGETEQLLSRSTDRALAKKALSGLRAGNTGADLTAALSLARAMEAEIGGVNVILYSDTEAPSPDVWVASPGVGMENRAVLSLSAAGGAVMARVANYGRQAVITAECWADGALCDARAMEAPEGETISMRFSAPESAAVILVRLTDGDAIETDDTAYFVRRGESETAVCLSGEDTFLEHALTLRGDVRLTRADEEAWAEAPGAKVYIRENGMVLFSREKEMPPVEFGDEKSADAPLTLSLGEGEAIGRYLTFSQVALRKYRPATGGRAFLFCGEDPVGAFGEDWVALGFDPHDSNLPLKYDFPVLIQNILSYLAPADAGARDGVCGQGLMLSAAGTVETPDGRRVESSPAAPFTDTREAGLYILKTREGEEIPFYMAMDFAESDVRFPVSSTQGEENAAGRGQREITLAPLLLALALILLEGGLSRRGGAY